jgi:hypothetical protein
MKLDTTCRQGFFAVLLLPLIFLAMRFVNYPLFGGLLVDSVEFAQALWLLFCSVFTLAYMKPWQLSKPKCMFWLWAAQWWLVLFGRSTSWGHEIFHDFPHWIFRILAVVWIAPLVLMLFSNNLRAELKNKLKTGSFPVAYFMLSLICFLISDTVEHKRTLYFIFVASKHYQDITEELYEVPFMLALFQTAFHFMKIDKKPVEVKAHEARMLKGMTK